MSRKEFEDCSEQDHESQHEQQPSKREGNRPANEHKKGSHFKTSAIFISKFSENRRPCKQGADRNQNQKWKPVCHFTPWRARAAAHLFVVRGLSARGSDFSCGVMTATTFNDV